MGEHVFFSTIAEKQGYFAGVMPFLDTNKVQYQVNLTKLGEAQALYGPVTTTGTYLYWKDKYDQQGKRKETLVTDALDEVTEKLEKKLTEIYNDIPASLWDTALRTVTNRKTGLPRTITHPTTPITRQCPLTITPLGGGEVKIISKYTGDSSKSSMPPEADEIEIAYRAVEKYVPGSELTGGKVRNMCTGPDDEGMIRTSRKRAIFILKLGVDKVDLEFQCYTRYIHSPNRDLDGPWTGPFTAPII